MEHAMEYGDYMPHGMCLLWQPWLIVLWAGSDLLIFLSYTAIPIALLNVLRKRTEVPHGSLVSLFAAFILLCGLTHFLGIVTLWFPIYPWVGWVKLATGLVSMTTAIVLFRLIPDITRLPSPAALEAANRSLKEEIEAHRATVASLDRQVRARTKELEGASAALAVQAREAIHRNSNLLTVVHSLASQSARGTRYTEEFLASFLGRIRALADTTRSISKNDQSSAELTQVIEAGLDVLKKTYGGRVSSDGPVLEIDPVAAQQMSLALYELGTNAQKYGLGKSDRAMVDVSWNIENGMFVFVWQERDIAETAWQTGTSEEGFGSTLLMRIVPKMLSGEAVRTYRQGKMTYRLTAPLAAVIARTSGGHNEQLAAHIINRSFGLD